MQYTESQLTDMFKVIRYMGNTTFGIIAKHVNSFFLDAYYHNNVPEDIILFADAIDLNDEAFIKDVIESQSHNFGEVAEGEVTRRIDGLIEILPTALTKVTENNLDIVRAFYIRLIERFLAE